MMNKEEKLQFIKDYVEICNTEKEAKSGILSDFVSKVGDDVFQESIKKYLNVV